MNQNVKDVSKSITNMDLKSYVDDILQQRRSKYEPDWYRNKHSYENQHFIGWNRVTGTIQVAPTKKRFFLQLPEVKRQCDAFENLLLRDNPIFQVYPTDYSDTKQVENARYQSLFLRQRYLDYHENNVMHELVHNAIVMPISFIEIAQTKVYDSEARIMKNSTVPRVYDAFDVAFDARFPFEDNPIIVKIVRTTPARIKQSKIYNKFDGGMIQSGTSDYKEMYFQDKFGNNTSAKDFNRVILYECHIKEVDKNGIPGVHIVTIDQQGTIMRDDFMTGMPFYSIIPFQPYSGNPYQPSFAQGLNPINRSMDLVANRIESMIMKIVKGSYMMPDNSDVTMSDEDGTIIKYRGAPPTVLPTPQIPAAAWEWMNWLKSAAERYGVNQLALGGTPQGSQFRAAQMMQQALKGATAQQKTPLENLMLTMRRMAEVILFMESTIMDTAQEMTLQDDSATANAKPVTKKFIGSDFADLHKENPNVVPLPKTVKKMTVQIEDEEATSIHAKRQSLIELIEVFAKTPQPLQKPLLDLYKVGNTSDIMGQMDQGKTILDSPEMQAIVAQNRQGMFDSNPELKKSIGVFLQFLSQQSPVPHPDQQGVQTLPPKPAGAPVAPPTA